MTRLVRRPEGNFTCSYRTVAGICRQAEKGDFRQLSGHLPLEHIPGEAQADFVM